MPARRRDARVELGSRHSPWEGPCVFCGGRLGLRDGHSECRFCGICIVCGAEVPGLPPPAERAVEAWTR